MDERVRGAVGRASRLALGAFLLCLFFAEPVSAQEPCPEPKGGPPPKDASGSGFCPPLPPDGTISADPEVCTIPAGSTVCTSTITWTSSSSDSTEVWVFSQSDLGSLGKLIFSLVR